MFWIAVKSRGLLLSARPSLRRGLLWTLGFSGLTACSPLDSLRICTHALARSCKPSAPNCFFPSLLPRHCAQFVTSCPTVAAQELRTDLAAHVAMCCRVPSQGIFLLAVTGLAVALYALYVEFQLADDPYYVASCDVGGMSCTAVFTSPYAHILSHWGLVPKGSALDLGLAEAGLSLYTGFLLYPILTFIPGRKYIVLAVSAGSVVFSLCVAWRWRELDFFCRLCCLVAWSFRGPSSFFHGHLRRMLLSAGTFCTCSSSSWASSASFARPSTPSISRCSS